MFYTFLKIKSLKGNIPKIQSKKKKSSDENPVEVSTIVCENSIFVLSIK